MENASKALIIAGSVLTSILIVATGVQIYNSTDKGLEEQAKQSVNKMWEGVDTSVGLGEGGGTEEPQEEMITFYFDGYYVIEEFSVPEGTTWKEHRGYSQPIDEEGIVPAGFIWTLGWNEGAYAYSCYKMRGGDWVHEDDAIKNGAVYEMWFYALHPDFSEE